MSVAVLTLLVYLSLALSPAKCANILFVVTAPFMGHQKVHQRMWDELALRGHNVTVITTSPLLALSLPEVSEIDLSSLREKYFAKLKEPAQINFTQPTLLEDAARYLHVSQIYEEFAERVYSHRNVREFLEKDNSFDVCVVESDYPAALGFAAKYRCILVVTSTSGFPVRYLEAVHNYPSSSRNSTGLLDKVLNSALFFYERFYYNSVILPSQDKIVRKYLGQDLPYLGEVQRNTSLVLINRNPVLDDVLPLLPNVVDIGGIYTSKPKSYVHLGLHIWLNISKEYGALGFNLEPNVKNCRLPTDLVSLFQEVFAGLPYDVVWRWEKKKMADQPKNVYIADYLPQYDMMGYENVTLLITEGYVYAIEDAISSGVPIIGIPFTPQSEITLEKYLQHGIGRRLHAHNLTVEVLNETILEVIRNPVYRENAVKLNKTMYDLPKSGLETAVWWIEYVIRRNGTWEIKETLITIPFYQYYMLDVVGVLLFVVGTVGFVLFKIVSRCLRCFVGKTKRKQELKEKKNK